MKAFHSLLLGIVLSVSPLCIHASEETHQAAAKEMVDVARVDKMLSAMYEQINAMLIRNLLSQDPCLESIKQPLMNLFLKYDEKILSPSIVKAEVQKIYVQEFTEDEIKQIVNFYKTPAGQKALEKSPLLAAKGMEIAQKEIEKSKNAGVMDSLQKDINALIDGINPTTLSAECKKKFEDRKARLKAEEKVSEGDTKAKAAGENPKPLGSVPNTPEPPSKLPEPPKPASKP